MKIKYVLTYLDGRTRLYCEKTKLAEEINVPMTTLYRWFSKMEGDCVDKGTYKITLPEYVQTSSDRGSRSFRRRKR